MGNLFAKTLTSPTIEGNKRKAFDTSECEPELKKLRSFGLIEEELPECIRERFVRGLCTFCGVQKKNGLIEGVCVSCRRKGSRRGKNVNFRKFGKTDKNTFGRQESKSEDEYFEAREMEEWEDLKQRQLSEDSDVKLAYDEKIKDSTEIEEELGKSDDDLEYDEEIKDSTEIEKDKPVRVLSDDIKLNGFVKEKDEKFENIYHSKIMIFSKESSFDIEDPHMTKTSSQSVSDSESESDPDSEPESDSESEDEHKDLVPKKYSSDIYEDIEERISDDEYEDPDLTKSSIETEEDLENASLETDADFEGSQNVKIYIENDTADEASEGSLFFRERSPSMYGMDYKVIPSPLLTTGKAY